MLRDIPFLLEKTQTTIHLFGNIYHLSPSRRSRRANGTVEITYWLQASAPPCPHCRLQYSHASNEGPLFFPERKIQISVMTNEHDMKDSIYYLLEQGNKSTLNSSNGQKLEPPQPYSPKQTRSSIKGQIVKVYNIIISATDEQCLPFIKEERKKKTDRIIYTKVQDLVDKNLL